MSWVNKDAWKIDRTADREIMQHREMAQRLQARQSPQKLKTKPSWPMWRPMRGQLSRKEVIDIALQLPGTS